MANISVSVVDGNNITLVTTPTPTQVITIDRGIAGPASPPGGATTQVQYNLAGVFAGSANLTFNGTTLNLGGLTASTALALDASKNISSITNTGTGSNVLANSPTLVTPNLGTPSALVGTNITGTATAFTASNVTTNANLTGAITSVGNATLLGSFTSLQLLTALTNETGTGANVFGTSPAITTSLTTASTTFALLNTAATTINFGGAATTVTIGAATGTITLGNPTLTGTTLATFNMNGASPSIVTSSTATASVFNTSALTGNLFGAATTVNIGAATGTMNVANTTLAAQAITASTTLGVTGVSTLTGGAVIEGLTVGRGGSAVGTNTAVGSQTLGSNTSGTNNTGVGYLALFGNGTGTNNVAVGDASLFQNTIGNFNTACGSGALATTSTGSKNTAIGYYAGLAITTGSNNVVVGGYDGSAAPISATGSNWIVLSDGAGNVRQAMDSAGNAQFLYGAVVVYAPTPAAISAAATLTNANLQTQLIVTSGTSFTLTMPTGSTLDTLISWSSDDIGFDFSIINTASSTITMAVNTGVTIVGRLTVTTVVSARFRIRRTAASTYIMYRIG